MPPAGRTEELTERLIAALRHKQLLLVLDNCEQVIDAVAELAELLLRSVPGVRILATSREPLGLSGELLWPVPTLELPDPAVTDDLDAVARCSAVQLFVQRAAAATAGFELTPSNMAAVAAICRRLDGLPLALELAAARVRVLPVHELAARLHDRFRLLAAGTRNAPARQQTLRAVVDWSWELLSGPEQAMLGRLGVFADGFTLAAAEAVGAASENGTDVLDLLARLVDRSLVVAEDGSTRIGSFAAGIARAAACWRWRCQLRHCRPIARRSSLRGPGRWQGWPVWVPMIGPAQAQRSTAEPRSPSTPGWRIRRGWPARSGWSAWSWLTVVSRRRATGWSPTHSQASAGSATGGEWPRR
ncbi:MAG: ATP-binding protein [Pseudonocardiales bacterium]